MILIMKRVAHVMTLVMLVSTGAHGEPDRTQTQTAMDHCLDGELRGGWVLVGMGAASSRREGPCSIEVMAISRRDCHIRFSRWGSPISRPESSRGASTQFTVLKSVEVVLIAGGVTTGVLAHRADRQRLEGVGYAAPYATAPTSPASM